MRFFWIGLIALILFLGSFLALHFDFFFVNAKFLWNESNHGMVIQNIQNPEDLEQDKSQKNILTIPSLGVHAPVVYVTEALEEVFQEALRNGVVHFPGTALPGESGNCYIFGHSSDNLWAKGDYKAVFALLPKIRNGDLIEVSDLYGNIYHYKVLETKVISSDDLRVLDQQNNDRKLLTLQTSYPLGTALKRFVVIAEIVP